MKSHLLFFLAAYMALQSSVIGQNTGSNTLKIGLLPFKYTRYDDESAALLAEGKFYEMLINSKRVSVLERTFFSDLEDEKSRQTQADFIDGTTISKTRSEGAKYLLVGQVASCSYNENRSKETGQITSYSCNLVLNIRLVDVESSNSLFSKQIQPPAINLGGLLKSTPTRETALSAAVDALARPMSDLLDEFFPIEAEIIEVTEKDATKVREVILGIGKSKGINKGDVFSIFSIVPKTINGVEEKLEREIGSVKVSEEPSQNLSTATVSKGGQDMLTLQAQGVKLIARIQKSKI
jgi:hypothetical protein